MNNLFFIMYERGFLWNGIRGFCSWLDLVAYTLFSWVMQLIFDIAAVSTSSVFNNFYDGIQSRIYALLAIFMLFKITISMLTYLVNPDSMNDKSQGVGKLSMRIIVSLVMLIAFPIAFQFLNRVQPHIMEALPRVILATNTSLSADNYDAEYGGQMEQIGEQIAFMTYHGVFFNTECGDRGEGGENDLSFGCFQYNDNTVATAVDHINDAADGDSDHYRYDYFPIVGFVTAIVMTLILLGYAVDVSIRVFKLIILQVIAPIPIISYMDPKSSKDGAFNKWVKMVISVWLDLFIKLGIIYFVMLVISELISSQVISNLTRELFGNNGPRGGLVLIALIVGLLFFAKDAPKFIADAMGIKMGENSKLFGGLGKIMAAGAIGTGAIGSAIAAGRASRMADVENGIQDKNAFVRGINRAKNVGAGLLGGVTGLSAGASAALSAKDHYSKAAMDAMAKRNATTLAAGAAGSTALGRALSTGSGLIFGETAAARGKREIANLEAGNKALDAVVARADEEAVKSMDTKASLFKGSSLYTNYKSFAARMEAAKTAGADSFEYTAYTKDASGNWVSSTQRISMIEAESNINWIKKDNANNYLEQVQAGTIRDVRMPELMRDVEAKTGRSFKNRNEIKDYQETLANDIIRKKRENTKKEQNDRFSGSGK